MNARDIPEIREAEAELQRAEKAFPSQESAEMFKDAFQSLEDFIELGAPPPEIVTFVSNLQLAYTRTIVERMNAIETKDIHLYFYYSVVLFTKMGKTVDKLVKMNPDFGKMLKQCMARFRPQLEELIPELRSRSSA